MEEGALLKDRTTISEMLSERWAEFATARLHDYDVVGSISVVVRDTP